jgi:preprotein translocase subunit SecE
MKIISKITNFFREVIAETKKISWPTKKETMQYTLIVIGVSIAVAFFLGTLDFIFTTILNKLIF